MPKSNHPPTPRPRDEDRKPIDYAVMTWILVCTALAYLIANAPLLYSLISVHRVDGTVRLWGYAPNQFLFLVLFYPLATFAALAALRAFVFKAVPTLPIGRPLADVVRNWPVSILIGIILSAIVGIVIYFHSAWSFDKLEPQYAQPAIAAMESVRQEVLKNSSKPDEQESFRKQLITDSKAELEAMLVPSGEDRLAVDSWMSGLRPAVYLQVVQRPDLQVRLGLVNPVIHPLAVLQLFSVIFVAVITLAIAGLGIFTAREIGYDGTNYPELTRALQSSGWAVFFFGVYSICYSQYRSQIESVVGIGTTVLQDVFTGFLVVAILVLLVTLDPANRQLSFDTLLKFFPAVVVGSGTVAGIASPQTMRQLIGSDTNMGVQAFIALVTILLALFPVFHLLPRD